MYFRSIKSSLKQNYSKGSWKETWPFSTVLKTVKYLLELSKDAQMKQNS